jgi:hypothetical protein
MKKRLDEGYQTYAPIEGQNLWRVFAGDRIIWVGPSRNGVHSENGVLELVDFNQNALVYGEPFDLSSGFPAFGGFDREDRSPEGVRLCKAGWAALSHLRPTRQASIDGQWRIG